MNYIDEELKKLIKKNLMDYVAVKTYTNTKLEKNTEDFFRKWFDSQRYFAEHPDHCGFYEIEGDYLNRCVPWGLVKGNGDDTIILIHHSDTVDTLDYGKYKDLAHDPIKITEIIKERKMQIPENVIEDVNSNKWLFGRGVADMKGGGAIQLSLIQKYSEMKNLNGNLLILALPDEENLSAGMRAAINLLKELKEKHSLNYVLMINSEPHERTDNDTGVMYDGSIGKVMPLVYVRGKLAHVGQIFNGLNPVYLLSKIVNKTELNTDFLDVIEGEASLPPTWLYFKDRKKVYDVSLPISAGGYMSVLTLKSSPKEILDLLEETCKEAFSEVILEMNNSYKEYLSMTGQQERELPWNINVKTFSQLYKEALQDSGEEFINAYKKETKILKEKIDNNQLNIPESCYILIEKTMEYVDDLSPVVVVALSPPYYPNVCNNMLKELDDKVENIVNHLIDFAEQNFEQTYEVQHYYTGISDLSYALFESNEETIDYIKNNMLLWGEIYDIPLDTIKELSIPVINIGPWGKDFHKYTERVFKEDLYYRTPKMIMETINFILNNTF